METTTETAATTEAAAITREVTIAASPETVWEFLVDSEKATRWMGTSAVLDPRPGGKYRVEVLPDNVALGEFVEVDPPRRLVYTFGWESRAGSSVPPGSSTIEIELAPEASGTRLHFTHRGLPDADSVARHSLGWDHYIERLITVAVGGDAGRDPYLDGNVS